MSSANANAYGSEPLASHMRILVREELAIQVCANLHQLLRDSVACSSVGWVFEFGYANEEYLLRLTVL